MVNTLSGFSTKSGCAIMCTMPLICMVSCNSALAATGVDIDTMTNVAVSALASVR